MSSFGIGFRVGPFYFRQPLRAGRGLAAFLTLPIYLCVYTLMAVWWVMKWIAVGTYLAGRWAILTALPAARSRWETRQAQQASPPVV